MKFYPSSESLDKVNIAIRDAEEGETVVIKMQTWFADEVGIEIGESCLEVLKSGVKVVIFKDTLGVFFEQSEGSGRGFFDEEASFNQGRVIGSLSQIIYQRRVKEEPLDERVLQIRSEMDKHIKAGKLTLNNEARYDHSKLVFIFDKDQKPKEALFGGVVFSDLFKDRKVKNKTVPAWADGMIHLEEADKSIQEALLLRLRGEESDPKNSFKFLSSYQGSNNKRDPYLESIRSLVSEGSNPRIVVPYLGDPQLISSIEESKSDVKITVPDNPNWFENRNRHFIWELVRRKTKNFKNGIRGAWKQGIILDYFSDFVVSNTHSIPAKITVESCRRMFHMKAFFSDETFIFGSKNPSSTYGLFFYKFMASFSRLQELGIEIDRTSIEEGSNMEAVVKSVSDYANSLYSEESRVHPSLVTRHWMRGECNSAEDNKSLNFSLLFSQLEHLIYFLMQLKMYSLDRVNIRRIREEEKNFFRSFAKEEK